MYGNQVFINQCFVSVNSLAARCKLSNLKTTTNTMSSSWAGSWSRMGQYTYNKTAHTKYNRNNIKYQMSKEE